MHPYQIRRLARERGKGILVDLRPGSLYRTIERLEREGLVEAVETTREGRFPERTVYRLTEQGQAELEEWLRELLSTPMKDFPRLLEALSVVPVLEPDDVRVQLEARLLDLEAHVAGMETTMRRLEGVLPRLFNLEAEYALALRRAEADWVRGVVEDMRTGRLTWSHAELRAQFGGSSTRPLELPGTGPHRKEEEEEDETME
jgi:DNA-binding PadR family transcriptional regulator